MNEKLAAHYVEQYGMDITAMRYGMIYGAGQVRGGSGAVVREVILNPAVGKPSRVPFGDDDRSWLYVDDAARAAVLASKIAKPKTLAFSVMGEASQLHRPGQS
ncbi:NAD-dependent epimerase/dehydratase family protein [Chloroflexota bacterium]